MVERQAESDPISRWLWFAAFVAAPWVLLMLVGIVARLLRGPDSIS